MKLRDWGSVNCGDCSHPANMHRERRKPYSNEKVCDGLTKVGERPTEECRCEKRKAEVVYDHFESRLSVLEKEIEKLKQAQNPCPCPFHIGAPRSLSPKRKKSY